MPQSWECKLLTILKSEPCLAIRRRTWSGRRVVSTARLIYPGHRYRLEARTRQDVRAIAIKLYMEHPPGTLAHVNAIRG